MSTCITNTTSPTNSTPVPCDGEYISTECSLSPTAISYLGIQVGDSQALINTRIVLALQNLLDQIEDLQTRVTDLETP